jgi:hypothetical protein
MDRVVDVRRCELLRLAGDIMTHKREKTIRFSAAGRAILAIIATAVSALAGTLGCAEKMADCVEVYPNTGATRLPGYTMTACQDHCKQVQGAIDCYWDGSIVSLPTGPSVIVEPGRTSTDRG